MVILEGKLSWQLNVTTYFLLFARLKQRNLKLSACSHGGRGGGDAVHGSDSALIFALFYPIGQKPAVWGGKTNIGKLERQKCAFTWAEKKKLSNTPASVVKQSCRQASAEINGGDNLPLYVSVSLKKLISHLRHALWIKSSTQEH